MSSYRNLVIITLLLLLAGVGFAVWNAEQHTPPPETPKALPADSNDMIGSNASFTVTEGEVKKWKLDAKTAVYNENRTEAKLKDVQGEFYDETGKVVLTFAAPQGYYSNKDNAVTLTGGAVAKSTQDMAHGGKGGELKAPKMVWDSKTSQVTASGGIELTFPQGKSIADVCKFTLDFSNISLQGNVSSTIDSP